MKVYWHDRMTQRPKGLCDVKLEPVKFTGYNSKANECPSIKSLQTNTFQIASPFGIKAEYGRDNVCEFLALDEGSSTITTQVFSENYQLEEPLNEHSEFRSCQIFLELMFWTDQDCLFYEDKYLGGDSNIRIIQGYMNIARWFRPMNFSFEFNKNYPVNIKYQEPLMQVRFFPFDMSPVKLVYSPEDEEKTTSFYRTHYGRANQFIKGKTWQAMQEAGKYFERLKKWK